MISMNISGIPSTTSGADLVNVKLMASIKVMGMEQDVFKDIAGDLIDQMSSAITGLGQNIDVYA